jgi:hypothetical protein
MDLGNLRDGQRSRTEVEPTLSFDGSRLYGSATPTNGWLAVPRLSWPALR